jgi:hypothetical protein
LKLLSKSCYDIHHVVAYLKQCDPSLPGDGVKILAGDLSNRSYFIGADDPLETCEEEAVWWRAFIKHIPNADTAIVLVWW